MKYSEETLNEFKRISANLRAIEDVWYEFSKHEKLFPMMYCDPDGENSETWLNAPQEVTDFRNKFSAIWALIASLSDFKEVISEENFKLLLESADKIWKEVKDFDPKTLIAEEI